MVMIWSLNDRGEVVCIYRGIKEKEMRDIQKKPTPKLYIRGSPESIRKNILLMFSADIFYKNNKIYDSCV